MTVFETTIRTGHPGSDQQALDQIRRSYEPRGLAVHATALGGGGMHVRVVQRSASPPPGPPPQPGWGPPPHPRQPQAQPQPYYYGAAPAYGASPSMPPSMPPSSFAYAGGGAAPMSLGLPGVAELGAERVRYLRKVYGLLLIAATFAIASGWLCVSPLLGSEPIALENGKHIDVPLVVAVMLENPAVEYGAFGALVVGVFLAGLVSKVRVVNVLALFSVSALMGLELAPMAFVAQVMAGLGQTLSANPVRDTFAMVGAIFFALTAYVFIARKDFSYLKATLSMGFMVVLVGCILTFVIGSELFALAVASAGAVLSIGFLLYQTSYILRNSDMDNPVDDALGLVVQLRNLFMFILRILMSSRR